jgi:hypothetical protein
MKLTHIHSGFIPLFWALRDAAHIEHELAQAPAVDRAPLPASVTEPPADIHPDRPLTLQQALALPELAGGISIYRLRAAIRDGTLAHERFGSRIRVTRSAIAAWREQCQDPARAPGSGSSPKKSTSERAGSGRHRSGSSETAQSARSLDALQMILRERRWP